MSKNDRVPDLRDPHGYFRMTVLAIAIFAWAATGLSVGVAIERLANGNGAAGALSILCAFIALRAAIALTFQFRDMRPQETS